MVRPLHASVGAAGAALLLFHVPQFEGMVLRGYKDPIGIVTACAGHTKTAVLGKPYTRDECEALLVQDLSEHAEGVFSCVTAPMTVWEVAAFTSFTYNVGVSAFCGSTLVRKFNDGNAAGACAELSRWTKAGGQELPGLVKRRAIERAMCEGDLG